MKKGKKKTRRTKTTWHYRTKPSRGIRTEPAYLEKLLQLAQGEDLPRGGPVCPYR